MALSFVMLPLLLPLLPCTPSHAASVGGFPQPPLLSWPLLKQYSPSPPQRVNVETVQTVCDPPIHVDGVFGAATKECVESLQRAAGLKQDGEVCVFYMDHSS